MVTQFFIFYLHSIIHDLFLGPFFKRQSPCGMPGAPQETLSKSKKSLNSRSSWKPSRKVCLKQFITMNFFVRFSFIYLFSFLRYSRIFLYFSVFREAILGQNYHGEDNHNCVSITISSNFASPDTYGCCSVLSIFSSPEHIVFKLNADQDKCTTCSTGNFGFVFERNKSEGGCLDSRCVS